MKCSCRTKILTNCIYMKQNFSFQKINHEHSIFNCDNVVTGEKKKILHFHFLCNQIISSFDGVCNGFSSMSFFFLFCFHCICLIHIQVQKQRKKKTLTMGLCVSIDFFSLYVMPLIIEIQKKKKSFRNKIKMIKL